MPFLRRRGVMASESDMRRHTSLFSPLTLPKFPLLHGHDHEPDHDPDHDPEHDPDHDPDHETHDLSLERDAHRLDPDPERPVTASTQSGRLLPGSSTPMDHATSATAAMAAMAMAPSVPALFSPVPPVTPPSDGSVGGSDITRGVGSTDSRFLGRPESPPVQEETARHRRFSLLRFRNASDPQLSARARLHAQAEEEIPPVPHAPDIIMTVPTLEFDSLPEKKASRVRLPGLSRKSSDLPRRTHAANNEEEPAGRASSTFGTWSLRERRKSVAAPAPPKTANGSKPQAVVAFDESTIHNHQQQLSDAAHGIGIPPAYGDDVGTTLALPVNRLSESSRSDGSSGDRVYGTTTTTTTTHTVHTTTFFRLPRRRKNTNPPSLFPIAHLPQKGASQPAAPANPAPVDQPPATPVSEAGATPPSLPDTAATPAHSLASGGTSQDTPTQSRASSRARDRAAAPASPSGPPAVSPAVALLQMQKGNPLPTTSFFRSNSRQSGQSSPTRSGGAAFNRGRSSTLSSLGRESVVGSRPSGEAHLSPPTLANAASGATGRKSFGDLLGLGRLRQNSEPTSRHGGTLTPLTPVTPVSNTSKNNSLHLPRDSFVLPERREDDTPAKYLARLEEVVSRSVIGSALSKSNDVFSQAVLRSYMRSFKFFGDPMDMAIRKLLMEAELPRETQHIDRFLQAFANRYHECNPGIFSSPDQAYFIAFSLLILHTDVFNKNNKHKMQKIDYQKNTRGEGIFDEILEVFYDNITYTPFIHVEDDLDINGERIVTHKAAIRKSIFPNGSPDLTKKSSTKEPIDPYTLILDDKLDVLRPSLKEVMQLDDPYCYLGTAKSLNMTELQKTFFRTGILQIVSARSRPDAFMTEKTASNPQEAHPGIVDIKITKVGLLWRKDAKKKKTRSPWQEWGAILTGAQLYFFRNTTWVKSLMHQYETHIRHGHDGIPIIFKPPLAEFKPDALMSTDGAVALLDSSYKKHKHAFVYVRHGCAEEVLLADNEEEMNDWLAKLNYAAAFRTSGVRMRGVVGGFYEGQNRRAIRQFGGSDESQSVQTPSGEVTITRSRIDQQMARDILAARRDIMLQKVADANEKLAEEEKRLEVQLRNARHLQILAPIQAKTREQMLVSAARMDTQLKWRRMEMWRLRCHREILEMDLEEERRGPGPQKALESGAAAAGFVAAAAAAGGMAVRVASGAAAPDAASLENLEKPDSRSEKAQQPDGPLPSLALRREESKASGASSALAPQSPYSGPHRGSLAGASIGSGSASGSAVTAPLMVPEERSDSPTSDAYQTPPTSAANTGFFQHQHQHRPQDSVDTVSTGLLDGSLDFRKGSVSSAMSSGGASLSIVATPPPRAHEKAPQLPSSSAAEGGAAPSLASKEGGSRLPHDVDPHAEDADEYALLQTTGLWELASARAASGSGKAKAKAAGGTEDEAVAKASAEWAASSSSGGGGLVPQDGPSSTPQLDRSKIRRSLQRTLREGAGHLSTRSRRSKDHPLSSSGGGVVGVGGVGSASASGSGAGGGGGSGVGGVQDDGAGEQPNVLERGAGSFVVHGKKASVIQFGGDFPSILPADERLRQRRLQQQQQQQQEHQAPQALEAQPVPQPSLGYDDVGGDAAPAALYGAGAGGDDVDGGVPGLPSDYRAAIFQEHERRGRHGSAASASTATARSFRELHRKYSSVRTASRSSTAGGKLAPTDDDSSEAAVSSSEGHRTPLPAALAEETPAAAAADDASKTGSQCLSGVGEAGGGEGELSSSAVLKAEESSGGDGIETNHRAFAVAVAQ